MIWEEALAKASYLRWVNIDHRKNSPWWTRHSSSESANIWRDLGTGALNRLSDMNPAPGYHPLVGRGRVISGSAGKGAWTYFVGDVVELYDADKNSLGIWTVGGMQHPHDQAPIITTEGDDMFSPSAAKTKGGYKAQILLRKTTDGVEVAAQHWPVIWEGTTVHSDDPENDMVTGRTKAVQEAELTIETMAESLFNPTK